MKSGRRSGWPLGTFDKVVRSEPLARAPRWVKLWVLNGDECAGGVQDSTPEQA